MAQHISALVRRLQPKPADCFGDWIGRASMRDWTPEFRKQMEQAMTTRSWHTTAAIWRDSNIQLLVRAAKLIDQGHFNNDIRDRLTSIMDADGKSELAARVRALPDRTVCGVEESWVEAALLTFCREEAARLMHLRADLARPDPVPPGDPS
jgi:hypothetical protein